MNHPDCTCERTGAHCGCAADREGRDIRGIRYRESTAWLETGGGREGGRDRVERDEKAGGCMVTACDNSYEIVSFIAGVITIIVILRLPTAIL